MKFLSSLLFVGTVNADPSRFLMQSAAVQPDAQSLLQESEDTPAKNYAAAMDKLRADRDMFARESAEYEQRAVKEPNIYMKFLLLASSLPSVLMGIRMHNPVIWEAQAEEVSFLEDTIKSMERNKEAVLKSNEDLDKLVKEDGVKLAELSEDTDRLNQHALSTLQNNGMSFLQLKNDIEDDGGPMIAQGPQSILERLRSRAASSEKQFQEAMKKLQADKEGLIKDENFRRARATQERRHSRI